MVQSIVNKSKRNSLIFFLCLMLSTTACTTTPQEFKIGERVDMPYGFIKFCKETPEDPSCK